MNPTLRYLSLGLVLLGVASLCLGGATLFLNSHHTIALGGLGIGAVLTAFGVGIAIKGGLSRLSGTGKQGRSTNRRPTVGRKLQSIIALSIILAATASTYLYVGYLASAQSPGQGSLSLSVSSATETAFPDGRIGVDVIASATGGVPPYTYHAVWNDETNQSSSTGNFSRVFNPSTPVSNFLTITARDGSKALGNLALTLPAHIPVTPGTASTETFGIASRGPQANSGGQAIVSTSVTTTFSAVTNVATPSVTATTTTATATYVTVTSPTFSTSANGGSANVTIAFMRLYSGSASSSTSQGTANVYLIVRNSGQPTAINSIIIKGGGLSGPIPVFVCPSTVNCAMLVSEQVNAHSATTFTDDRTSFYVGSAIVSGTTYDFEIGFANGQTISGSIQAG